MKKIIGIILCSFLILTSATEKEKSLLWRVSGNGLEKPSFLFGTIHMIPKNDFFFTDIMEEKFDSCSALMLEMKMDIPLKEQLAIANKVRMPLGKTYKDYLSEEDYNNALKYLIDTLGMKEGKVQNLQNIQPMMASSLVYKEALGKIKAYETELDKMAKKNKMNLLGFETLEDQMSFITSLSIEEQFEMTEINSNLIKEYYGLLDVYKQQDVNEMWEFMKEGYDEMMESNFYKNLLLNRNLAWVPQIKEQSKKESTFYAVGAAHLGGPDGVIALLRKEGYTVTPVN